MKEPRARMTRGLPGDRPAGYESPWCYWMRIRAQLAEVCCHWWRRSNWRGGEERKHTPPSPRMTRRSRGRTLRWIERESKWIPAMKTCWAAYPTTTNTVMSITWQPALKLPLTARLASNVTRKIRRSAGGSNPVYFAAADYANHHVPAQGNWSSLECWLHEYTHPIGNIRLQFETLKGFRNSPKVDWTRSATYL